MRLKLKTTNSNLSNKKPFEARRELEAKFSISKDEPTENKSLLAYIWAAGKGTNSEELIALGVLDELLLGSNTAPIKKALLKSGLVQMFLVDLGQRHTHQSLKSS